MLIRSDGIESYEHFLSERFFCFLWLLFYVVDEFLQDLA